MYELTPRKEKKRARERERERGGRRRGRDKIFAGEGMKYDFICRWSAQLSSMGLAVQLYRPVSVGPV